MNLLGKWLRVVDGWLPGNASIGADFFCQIVRVGIVQYLLFLSKKRALNGVESCGRGVVGTCVEDCRGAGRCSVRASGRIIGEEREVTGSNLAEGSVALNATEWCRTGLDCAEYGGMVRSGAVDESEFKGDAE